MNISRTAFL